MKKLINLFGIILILTTLPLVASCGSDKDDEPDNPNESSSIAQTICGYWNIVSTSANVENMGYSFISFSNKGEYAMFLGNNIFGSGVYDVNGKNVIATSGFNTNKTTITVDEVNNDYMRFSVGGKSFQANKAQKSPISLESIIIGKSAISYLGSGADRKEITTSFNTKYDGERVLKYSYTKNYKQTFEYVYNGNILYIKRYENQSIQNPTIGGWNSFDFNTVWIYNAEITNGNVSFSTVEDFKQ